MRRRKPSPRLWAAIGWLVWRLSRGPQPAATVLSDGQRAGLSRRTLCRAKRALGAQSNQRNRRWEWELLRWPTEFRWPNHPNKEAIGRSYSYGHSLGLSQSNSPGPCLDCIAKAKAASTGHLTEALSCR